MFEAVVLDKLYIWTASRQPEAVENSVGTIIVSTASTSNVIDALGQGPSWLINTVNGGCTSLADYHPRITMSLLKTHQHKLI
jgi:hypothetical protein